MVVKAALNKLLRSYSAHWITSADEPIIGLLITKNEHDKMYHILTKYAKDKGWVRSEVIGLYETFFFTEKGMEEVLQPLKEKTCITGRTIR